MSLINISNLTFSYEGSYDNIFENVSFQLDTDWRLGFTGRNGRGKTTFLNLLLGRYAYSGTITSSVTFEYFPYSVPDKGRRTAEILTRLLPDGEDWRIQRELGLLGVPENALDRPFQTLSNGEQTKILLAAVFLKDNRFLLIDEPTNHLDLAARETVGAYLNKKKGFILVSHDRAFLDSCVDHILSVNRTNIEIQKGNFSSWWQNKQLQDSFETTENEKRQREIAHLEEAARRTSGWSDTAEKTKRGTRNSGLRPDRGYIGHKAAKMMKRSKAIENRRQDAVSEKSKLLKNIETSEPLKISPLHYHSGQLADLDNISILYDGTAVCTGVSFSVRQGGRIALSGKNGSGKSSILKLLCGKPIPYTGTLRLGSGLKVSYIPQDTSSLCGRLTDYADSYGIDESLFKAILRKLDFSRVQFDKDMADFSDGQKKKTLLARSLCEKAHLYIWDEPLNFIDVLSRIQLEDLLTSYAPTVLFVEHDRSFLDSVATQTVFLS